MDNTLVDTSNDLDLDVGILFDDSVNYDPSLSSCCCCCTAAASQSSED